jgi:septal ring factor EnvC (AmiA/AmiB activator)
MRLAFKKLFESGQDSVSGTEGNALRQGRDEDSAVKYEKVSCTFDSIGQRNETLRAQLELVEFSFRDIEAIRTQFHHALTSIDQTLVEIERTKVAQLEAERKLENVTAANDRPGERSRGAYSRARRTDDHTE